MLDRLYVFDGFAGWEPEVSCCLLRSSTFGIGLCMEALLFAGYLPNSKPKGLMHAEIGSVMLQQIAALPGTACCFQFSRQAC